MLIFAWIILVLSSIALLLTVVLCVAVRTQIKVWLCGIFPKVLEILGCLSYIFAFSFLPYSLIIGASLGATLLFSILTIPMFFDDFDVTMFAYAFPSYGALVFFVLAAVQHLWPHLITF